MDSNYCKICSYSDLDCCDNWHCNYWNEDIEDIRDCQDRQVDGL